MDSTTTTSAGRRARIEGWVAVAVVAVLVLPVVISGVAGALRHWIPAGDWAVLDLRTADVGTAATPLVGPYSRFGWDHPGPLLFYLLAVPYRLAGGDSSALLAGAALINAASLIGMGWLAWRRGRLAAVVVVSVVMGALVVHLGPSLLRDPWNPSITVLPLGLLLLASWSALEGDGPALVVAGFVGSFLVQSHVGFAAIVAVLWLWSAVGFVLWCRRADRSPARWLWLAGALVALCWLPVLLDQFFGLGNLRALIDYFTSNSEPAAGLHRAASVVARELGRGAPWRGGLEPVEADGSVGGAPLVSLWFAVGAFIAAAAAALWARRRPAARRQATAALGLQATVAVACLTGLVSVSRITGPVFNYLVRWWWLLAALWWVSVVWSAWSSVQDLLATGRRKVVGPVLMVLGSVVLVGCAVRTSVGVGDIGTPDGDWWVQLDTIVPQAVAALEPGRPVYVQGVGARDGSVADGVRVALDRAGIPVRVDDSAVNRYGRSRSQSAHPAAVTAWVVSGPAIADFADRADMRQVASWDPLSPQDRADYLENEALLEAQLTGLGRDDLVVALRSGGGLDEVRDLPEVDQQLFEDVEAVRRMGEPFAVFVANAGS